MTKTIIYIALLATIYFFALVSSYNYDSDFGRDINDISKITSGDMTLLGPKLSFGGIHAGPYYYYLFTPAILFFKNNPESMLYLNASIFIIIFVIIYKIFGLLPSLYLSTLPLVIYSARSPGNAFSYISLLTLALLLFPQVLKLNKRIVWLIYGFVAGVIINFHLINLVIFGTLFISCISYFIYKKQSKNIINIFIAGFGIIIAFSPLILFEVTHNFVQIRNTFIDQSYQAFTNNTNLANNPLITSSNPLINLWFLQKYYSAWSGLPFILLFVGNILLFIKTKNKSGHQIIIFFTSIISYLIFAIIAQSQLAFHYFFPFIIITAVSIVNLLPKNNHTIIYILIIGNMLFFPTSFYKPATRNIIEYKTFSNNLINSEIFKKINNNSFNLYCARETTVAPLGWEYRYYLNNYGYQAKTPTEFAQSQNLLIIQESTNHETIDTLRSWGLDQFGPKTLVDKLSLDNRTIYLFQHDDAIKPQLK